MIFEKYFNAEAKRKELEQGDYHEGRIGFWGIVLSVDSKTMTCTVKADTQRIYKNISVMSKEWVCENESYVSASRNLPPIGSIVFVLTPTRTISGSFILCSGYTKDNENLKTLFAEDYEKDLKNQIKEIKTCGGWTFKENYESGNISLISDSDDIQIEINPNDDLENNQSKRIYIKGFETEITINKKGINIKTKSDLETAVEGNTNIYVEGDLSTFVSGNCESKIEGNSTISIKGNCEAEIEGTTKINAKKDVSLKTSKLTINDTSLEIV